MKSSGMPRQNLLPFRSNKRRAEDPDEKEVIRACLEGDRQAFERIVESYRNKVYWTAYNLVLDSEDARDIAQQSFLKIWKSLREYDFERSFAGWISRITANCAIDFLRGRTELEEIPEDIAQERSSIEQDLDVRKIFLRVAPLLSQRQRIVLVLREIHGMEIAEISDLLECTESTVRNLLSQAKDSFRRKAKELFPDYGL
jgi:RNA polymerase sigma-70 factor (ECF subfamily)